MTTFICSINLMAIHCLIGELEKPGRTAHEKKVAEKEDAVKGKKEDEMGGSLASTNHDREEKNKDPYHQKASSDDRSSGGSHTGKASLEESRPDCADDQKSNRPMSPGTLALMCDEQDTMFTTSQNAVPQQTVAVKPNRSELYAEQERSVLTEFRDCLRKLVTYGRMKGTPNIPNCHATANYWTFFFVCFVKLRWV